MSQQSLLLISLICSTIALGCKSTGSKVSDEGTFNPAEEKAKIRTFIDLILKDDDRLALTIVRYPPMNPEDISGPMEEYRNQLNSLSELATIFPYSDEKKSAFREVWQTYTKDIQNKLLLRSQEYASHPGDKMYLSSTFIPDAFEYDVYFTNDDLLNAARRLQGQVTGVSWNGNAEKFEYTDSQLKLAVMILASKLATNPTETISLLESNKLLTPLRINRQSADPATRTELFDLVQGQITASIHHRSFGGEGNRISITKAVHKNLYKLLNMNPSLDDRAAEYQDIYFTSVPDATDSRQILAACKHMTITDKSGSYLSSYERRFISMAKISLIESYLKQPLKLTCDDDTYSLDIEKIRAEPLPLPAGYDIQKYAEKGEVNVLLTYAFSNETDVKLLAGIVSYLGTKGYYLNPASDIKRGVATFDGFKAAFNKTDIYIPAAHLLDLNTFELGTDKSTVMTFTKKFKHKNGSTIKAKVTAFFPEKNSGSMRRLNRSDLAALLTARRVSNPTSLFVLTTSCRAADAVSTWTSAYRESLEQDVAAGKLKQLADAKDMIHAIAPEGSFPTSTPSELLLDFVGPLDAMKIIFEGGTPADVYTQLQHEIKPDRFVRFIQKIERLVAGKKGKLQPVYFRPKYNLKEVDLLDQKGFEYKLTKLESAR